jgi:hypothetical protein
MLDGKVFIRDATGSPFLTPSFKMARGVAVVTASTPDIPTTGHEVI